MIVKMDICTLVLEGVFCIFVPIMMMFTMMMFSSKRDLH